MDQLSLIFDVVGAPAPKEVAHIRGAQARKFLDKLNGKTGVAFSDLLPGTPEDAASLLKNLLMFDPLKRCTTEEALRHPFFDELRYDTVRYWYVLARKPDKGRNTILFFYHHACIVSAV